MVRRVREHGTRSCYVGGCRCKSCCGANKEYLNTHEYKSVCEKGHDIIVVGRNKRGTCQECVREYERSYRRRARQREASRIAGEPVLSAQRLYDGQSMHDAALAYAVRFRVPFEKAGEYARELFTTDWIPLERADEWCIAFDTHLSIVFPELFHGGDEDAVEESW
jgi:hypothetical protein